MPGRGQRTCGHPCRGQKPKKDECMVNSQARHVQTILIHCIVPGMNYDLPVNVFSSLKFSAFVRKFSDVLFLVIARYAPIQACPKRSLCSIP
jgi:hypothetical protein